MAKSKDENAFSDRWSGDIPGDIGLRYYLEDGIPQNRQKSFGFARYLQLPDDLACAIHNANARVLDRYVQSRKIIHAALLHLMLEAAIRGPCFTPQFPPRREKTSQPGRWRW